MTDATYADNSRIRVYSYQYLISHATGVCSPVARHYADEAKTRLQDQDAYVLDEIQSERNFADIIGRVGVWTH
jgi:hypothetical protein